MNLREKFEKDMGDGGNPLGTLYSRKTVGQYIVEAYERTIKGVLIQVWEEAEDPDKRHPKGRKWDAIGEKEYNNRLKGVSTSKEIEAHNEAVREMKEDYHDLKTEDDVIELIAFE